MFTDDSVIISDPLSQRTDAELLSAMRRSGLLSRSEEDVKGKAMVDGDKDEASLEGKDEKASGSRFDLNAPVSEEGSNFSAGERQLIALCRALVKESRVIVMVRPYFSGPQLNSNTMRSPIG
jgi:ATP-binding cassette, subfamily C (CFTR/MRP), member 1